jgi:acyl-CoA synthetase (AMP-forming)/AMP-acid ligase II
MTHTPVAEACPGDKSLTQETCVLLRSVSYNCPSELRVVGRLPMTGAQKPDRIALRLATRGEQELPAG